MLYDGISISEGGNIANATIASGSTFPSNPSTGELFFRTDSPNVGLNVYDGVQWQVVGGTVDFDSFNIKQAVRAATTGPITLSGAQTVDGVALVAGNRVLVKNQSTASENGIYVVSAGAWSRASDFDGSPSNEVKAGDFAFVTEGTVNADTGWVLSTNGTITIGATSLTFAQFTGASAVPGGSSGAIQFNSSGVFDGTAGISTNGSNLTFTTSGARIVGNFSDSTPSNRLSFSTSTSNSGTFIQAVPNGTGTSSAFITSNGDINNSGLMLMGMNAGVAYIDSTKNGTGVTRPLTILMNSNEIARFSTTGALSFGATGTNFGTSGQVLTSNGSSAPPTWQAIPTQTVVTNLAGGAAGQIPYQSGVGATTFSGNLTFSSNPPSLIRLGIGDSSVAPVELFAGGVLTIRTRDAQYPIDVGPGPMASSNDASTAPSVFHGGDNNFGRRAGPALFRGGDATSGSLSEPGDATLRGGNNNGPLSAGIVYISGGVNSGAGSHGYISFNTAGVERMTIGTGGTISMTGIGQSTRFRADFSSAGSTRTFFTTTIVNGSTNVGIIPNGTGTQSNLAIFNTSGLTGEFAQLIINSSVIRLDSGGTAPKPITITFSGTETARFGLDGSFLIGTTTTSGNGVKTLIDGTGAYMQIRRNTASTTNHIEFSNTNGTVGTIQTSGSATSFNTSSDARLKDNIVDAPSAISKVKAMQVRSFDWKTDGSHVEHGFIAQELNEVEPLAVTQGETWAIDPSKLVATLTKALQEALSRIEMLETEVQNLKK